MPIIQNIPAYRLQILNNLSSLNNNIPLISNLVLSSSGSPTKIYKTENNFSLHKNLLLARNYYNNFLKLKEKSRPLRVLILTLAPNWC